MDPVEKLLFVLVVELDELLPLPTERRGRPFHHGGQVRWKQSRYAAPDCEARLAFHACQLCLEDLFGACRVLFRVAQLQLTAACRAREQVQQPRLHDALRATHSSDAPNGMSMRRRIGISD